jgi:hypothetical protein
MPNQKSAEIRETAARPKCRAVAIADFPDVRILRAQFSDCRFFRFAILRFLHFAIFQKSLSRKFLSRAISEAASSPPVKSQSTLAPYAPPYTAPYAPRLRRGRRHMRSHATMLPED